MRERFNLDVASLDRLTMLIHGNYGVGKTFLLGDFLRTSMKEGKKIHFLNLTGEDGTLSVTNLGLGNVGENVDTFDDFKAALEDVRKAGVQALAIDGLQHLSHYAIRKVCGDRMPEGGMGGKKNEWGDVHKLFFDTVSGLRRAAPLVVCASASDRSMDQVSGELSLTPDMVGKQAAGVAGKFDFVFFLTQKVLGPNKTKYSLVTVPIGNTVVRYRLPKRLPAEIDIPEGGGGWSAIYKELQKALDSAPAGIQGVLSTLSQEKKEAA